MGALSFEHWLLVIAIVGIVIAPGWCIRKAKDLGKAKRSMKDLTE